MDLITIKGTAQQGTLIIDALCSNYGYQDESQESKGDFSKRMVMEYLKDNVKAYRAKEAETVRLTKIDEANTESDGLQAI